MNWDKFNNSLLPLCALDNGSTSVSYRDLFDSKFEYHLH